MKPWDYIKSELLFAGDMSNKDLLKLILFIIALAPFIYFSIIGLFALGYMIQGVY